MTQNKTCTVPFYFMIYFKLHPKSGVLIYTSEMNKVKEFLIGPIIIRAVTFYLNVRNTKQKGGIRSRGQETKSTKSQLSV